MLLAGRVGPPVFDGLAALELKDVLGMTTGTPFSLFVDPINDELLTIGGRGG